MTVTPEQVGHAMKAIYHDRKLKRVLVSPELFGHLVRDGEYRVRITQGLPPTARFVAASFDEQGLQVLLFFTDESFPPVPIGERPPTVEPLVEQLR